MSMLKEQIFFFLIAQKYYRLYFVFDQSWQTFNFNLRIKKILQKDKK